MKKIIFFLFFVFYSFISISQDTLPVTDIYELSLKDLINYKVSVGTISEKQIKTIPNIVTLITAEEIKNLGATNLLEILRFVPGLDFGAELDNVTGLGVRGNNATEGKVLILLDGQELNETNYGSFDFGQHILASDIQKIEILRGPGSAIYGGSAELAVINIVSKSGSEIHGVNYSGGYNYSHSGTLAYQNSLLFGDKTESGLIYSLSLQQYSGVKSNLGINTFTNQYVNYADSSNFDNYKANFGISYKNLEFRYIYDYKNFDNLQKRIGSVLFDGHYAGLKYKYEVNDKVSIVPQINLKVLKPWQFIDFQDYQQYNTLNTRLTAKIITTYSIAENVNLIFGLEHFFDKGEKLTDSVFYSNYRNEIIYENSAVFFETSYNPKFAFIVAGARLDFHEQYGFAFVPRFAVIKEFDKFFTKLMFSRAFKAPTIQNIDINNEIKPEMTNSAEIQNSFQITDFMLFNINVFYIDIRNAIVYLWFNDADHYVNYDFTGSKGVELEFLIRKNKFDLNLGYSFYHATNKNTVPDYVVDGNDNIFGAFPNHKASAIVVIKILKKFNLTSSNIFYSNRYTYFADADYNLHLKEYDPCLISNLTLNYSDLFVKGLDFSAGVYDLLDVKYQFINPYRAGIEPIYDSGRRFYIKLSYQLNFMKL